MSPGHLVIPSCWPAGNFICNITVLCTYSTVFATLLSSARTVQYLQHYCLVHVQYSICNITAQCTYSTVFATLLPSARTVQYLPHYCLVHVQYSICNITSSCTYSTVFATLLPCARTVQYLPHYCRVHVQYTLQYLQHYCRVHVCRLFPPRKQIFNLLKETNVNAECWPHNKFGHRR